MIYVAADVGSQELAPLISARITAPVVVTEMQAGDFAFSGNGPHGKVFIGLERKALPDFIASMRSGRYAGHQLVKMSAEYDVCFLIVEGIYRPSAEGVLEVPVFRKTGMEWTPYRLSLSTKRTVHSHPLMYSELDRFFTSLECIKNVIVLRSMSKLETAWQVINRYQWYERKWADHNSTDQLKLQAEVTFAYISLCRKIAASLPGVGWKISKRVADHFQTVERMALASEEEWRGCVGQSLAAKLILALRSAK